MAEKKVAKKEGLDIAEKVLKQKRNLEDYAFYILALVVFLLPIFFLPLGVAGFIQSKVSIFTFGTIFALCLCIIDRIKKGAVSISFAPTYIIMGILVLVYFVSAYLGINPSKSILGSLVEQDTLHVLLVGFIFIALVSHLTNTTKRAALLVRLFLGSICLAMFAQVLRITFGGIFTLGILGSPVDTLSGGWSDMTILSLLLLGSLVILLETVKLKKWLFAGLNLLIILPFLFVVLSGISFDFYFASLSLSLLMAIVSIVMFAYVNSLRKTQKETEGIQDIKLAPSSKLSSLFIVLLLSIILVIFGSPINQFLSQKTGVQYTEGRPSWQATYLIADKVLSQKSFFGSGPNTFSTEWDLNKSSAVNNYPFWNNEFNSGIGVIPTTIITTGIVGFILWIMFYVLVIVTAFKTLFKRGEVDGDFLPKVIVSFGVILTSFVMIFYAGGFVAQFANLLFIGLLFSINKNENKVRQIMLNKSQWLNFISTLVFILGLIVLIYWMYIVSMKMLANNYYRSALLSSDPDKATLLVGKAITIDGTEPGYYQSLGQIYASKVAKMMSLSPTELESKKTELNNNITNSLNFMVAGERVDPNDYRLKISTGKVLEFFGTIGLPDATKGAINKYMGASTNSPTNPLPYLFASNISLNSGDKAGAKDYLTKAVTLKSNYSDVPGLAKEIQALVEKLNKGTVSSVISTDNSSTASPKPKKVEPVK